MTEVQNIHCKEVKKPRPLRRTSSKSDSDGETPLVVNHRPVHLKCAEKPRPLRTPTTARNETTTVLVKQEPADGGASCTNGTTLPEVPVPEKVSPSYGPKQSQRTRLIDKSYDVTDNCAAGVLKDERGDYFAPVHQNSKKGTQLYFPVRGDLKKETQECFSAHRHSKRETQEYFPVHGDSKLETQEYYPVHRDATKEPLTTKAEAPGIKYTQPLNMDKVKISRECDSRGSTSIARLSIPKAEGTAVENRKVTGFVAMVTGTDIMRVDDDAVTFDIMGTREQQDKAIDLILERCYDTDLAPKAYRFRSDRRLNLQISVHETLPVKHATQTTVHRQVSVPTLHKKDTDAAPVEKTTSGATFEQGARRTRWGPEKTTVIPTVEDIVMSKNLNLEQEIKALEKQLRNGQSAVSRKSVKQCPPTDFSAYIESVKKMVETSLQDHPEPHETHLEAIPEVDSAPVSHRFTRFGGGDTREFASSRVSPPVMTSPRTVTSPIPIANGTSSAAQLPGSRLSPRLSNLLGRLKIRGRDMVARGGQPGSSPVSPELVPLEDSDSEDSEAGVPGNTLDEDLISSVGITGTFSERRRKILVLAKCVLSHQTPVGWAELILNEEICNILIKPKQMFDPEIFLGNTPAPKMLRKEQEQRSMMRKALERPLPDGQGMLDDPVSQCFLPSFCRTAEYSSSS